MTARVRSAAVALMLAATALTMVGCSSDEASSVASASPSPSPTPTPTPAPVVWAGQVCVERDNLKAAVSAFGRNLNYDVTRDASALEQIDRQLRIQALVVADALDKLGTALAGVPVDFVAANDLVVSVQKQRDDTKEAIAQVTTSLDAATSSDNVISAAAEVGKAVVAGKAAFEAGSSLVSTLTDAAGTANTEVQAAFDAAPECQAG